MREIKFRGFSKTFTENEWFNGDLIHYDENTFYIMEQNYRSWDIYSGIEVHKESIGQYTGLKDKDGKEIYEGDILLQSRSYIPENNIKHRVEFSEKFCGFVAVPMEGEVYRDSALCLSEEGFRIIGNIFENKELLKTE